MLEEQFKKIIAEREKLIAEREMDRDLMKAEYHQMIQQLISTNNKLFELIEKMGNQLW